MFNVQLNVQNTAQFGHFNNRFISNWTIEIPDAFLDVTQKFVGTNLTISGWGYTVDKGSLSPNLRYAFINGWNNTACKATGYGSLITDNMICASSPKLDVDTCQGDSGGLFNISQILQIL